ncbi:MAG TPA: hypothetical protein VMI56_26495 [Reyranella sp.]|nr:hypothetical protein [Reyranella sp.]
MDITTLAAALEEIEHALQHFLNEPDSNGALLEVLHRRHATLNEPYGFDPDTDALRQRVWRDCVTVISNLELTPEAQAAMSEPMRAQVQKLETLTRGLIDLVGPLGQKH